MSNDLVLAPQQDATLDRVLDMAVSVRNLSKVYRIYDRPQERLKLMFLARFGRTYGREFWALRDVSFDLKKGNCLGIIGRNGSGKSTLLQIVAGTLRPSAGAVRVNGRVAALLELGSGFNPCFTGRENVFLNGAVLGLSHKAIKEGFEEIAAFADIGQFLDQPVKLYSNGMIFRLAFAVQVFVPKEVLIVDEALAVGDEAFQRKCMAALEKFLDAGGTVLLVTHDTQKVIRLCNRCLLLHQGELLADGESKPVTDLYQKITFSDPAKSAKIVAELRKCGLDYALNHFQPNGSGRNGTSSNDSFVHSKSLPSAFFDPRIPKTSEVTYGNGDAEIIDYGMHDADGRHVNILVVGEPYTWTYVVRFHRDAYDVNFGMMIKTIDGLEVVGISSQLQRLSFDFIKAATIRKVSFAIRLNVTPETYFLNSGVDGIVNGERTFLQRRVDICMVRVLAKDSKSLSGIAFVEPEISVEELEGPLEQHPMR